MQKLEERDTYTPTNIPHVCGNCGLVLKRDESLSVPDLKTSQYCKCGCGQKISIKFHHKYYGIPYYINGHNRPAWTEESRNKLSKTLQGKKKTKNWCEKHSNVLKEGYRNGKIKSQRGIKKMSSETKEKIRQANLREKNPNWQGGKSLETYTSDFKKKFRHLIWERDKYICQLCGQKVQSGLTPNHRMRPTCHHIDYCKTNNSMNNDNSLCKL